MAGLSDDDLTSTGRQQCQQLAQALWQQDWQPSHIYCSPLRRALNSVAELVQPWGWQLSLTPILQTNLNRVDWAIRPQKTSCTDEGLPQLTVAKQLQEFDVGLLTGLTWQEAQERYPELCQALETSSEWVAIPDAESPHAGRDRATRFIQKMLAYHHNQDMIWVMSHHWIMEHLIAAVMGCDRTWKIHIPNTALFEFWIDHDRWLDREVNRGISDLWQIKKFGDCHHLSVRPESY